MVHDPDVGGLVLFTPPYKPDANAIEWIFGEMNKVIRRDQFLPHVDPRLNPEEAIHNAMMEAGTHAGKFVSKSAELVDEWYKPEVFGSVEV